jgi:hypothetical protein
MKKLIVVLTVLAIACNHPMRVTTIPDRQNQTSGTLGSARVQNEVARPMDTARVKSDTLRIRRDR